MSGVAAATAINKGVSAQINKKSAKKLVKQNESKFAGAYRNFQEKTGRTDEQMAAYTQNLLDGNYDIDKMSQDEYEYQSYVRQMKQTYNVVGEDNIDDRMMDTINMINDGTIEPDYGSLPQNQDESQTASGESQQQIPEQNQQQMPEQNQQQMPEQEQKKVNVYSDNASFESQVEQVKREKEIENAQAKVRRETTKPESPIVFGNDSDIKKAREDNATQRGKRKK